MRPVNKNISISYLRPFIATAMVASGLMNLAAPIYAAGTAAGTDISNTATATYEDPNGGVSNTTSNTVTIAVAEVAGITITSTGVTNVGTGTIAATGALPSVTTVPVGNDKLVFEFNVTNTGNDTTSFHIPNVANVGGSPVTVLGVEYFDGTTWKNVDTVSNTIATNSVDGGVIKPADFVKVRVITQVNAGATTGDIKVTLGNTGASDLQNVTYAADGGSVYTVDNTGGTGETAGAPVNGVMEAAASGTSAVNPGKQAFVKITETAVSNNAGTPNSVTDDKITYKMAVDVADTAPIGTNKVADDLAPTPIKYDGTTVNKVLVSNAIPIGTVLDSAPIAPAGWTVVYTTTPVGAAAANDPSVAWTSTAPANLATVTRVGYVKDGIILKTDPAITGFEFTVLTSGIPASGGNVLDIAQVFGTTPLDAAGTPDITKPAMDESGDSQYNNLDVTGAPGPSPTNGVATASNGVDPNDPTTPTITGTSAGTGPGGESTTTSLVPANQAVGVSNGPANQPGATGPTGTNDDFTNKSVTIDATDAQWANGAPKPVDPQALGFANTVKNDSPTTPALVSLLPTAPANKTDLPDGTIVKILGDAGATAVYTYNQATGTFTLTSGSLVTLNVPANSTANYGVEVDLPANTPQMTGFPASITAFADGTPAIPQPDGSVTPAVIGNGVIDPTDAQNISIDRVYTGYIKLMKEAQVTDAAGNIVSPFSAAAPKAAPGQSIQYRIKYNNITEAAPTGSGSVGLAANKVKIVEDGTLAPNNWAMLTDNKASSASDSLGGAILYDGGAKTASDAVVNQYLDTVPSLAPGAAGQFSFTRVVK